MGNFWMRPIASAFNQDQLRYLEVQLMSWNAVDNYFKGFSGTDYTKWINNRTNLKNQYDSICKERMLHDYLSLLKESTPIHDENIRKLKRVELL